jgi:hypothetical protein
MSGTSKMASVEQDSPSRPPVLTKGDLTPAVMRSFEQACFGYFENKDIADDKKVKKILASFQDSRIQDWISVERHRFINLVFADFMAEFRAAYLPEDWEGVTRIELLSMMQNELSFWDFAIAVQAKNSLLINTTSHLEKEALRHRIESGLSPKLALRCRLVKAAKIEKFEDWLSEIKRVDDLIRAERSDFEALAKSTRENSRRANALSEPSRRLNTNTATTASSSTITSSQNRVTLPKLTELERKLLYDNEGCLKCRRFFRQPPLEQLPKQLP